MLFLLLAHLVAAALAPALVRAVDRYAFLLLALVPGASFVWLLARGPDVTGVDARTLTETYEWVPTIGLEIALRLDTLSWTLALLVTGVGALVLFYCTWYFRSFDPALWRFSGAFTAFAGSMLGLVLSRDVLLLYVFWELTTVFSYILVGHNPERVANRRAAMTALIVTTFGGLAMLVGFVMLGQTAGAYRIDAIMELSPTGAATATAIALVLVGAVSKSALVPFHFWLPGAMAAPTPVSAYLHAAAMVKAGVFLVAVLAPAFADTRPVAVRPSLVLGVLTMLVGGLRALGQHDVKLLLAYGTVSQLGFLVAIVGLGTRAAALAGIAMVVAHALFKAALFMVVGIVDHAAHTRDLRKLSGLRPRDAVVVRLHGPRGRLDGGPAADAAASSPRSRCTARSSTSSRPVTAPASARSPVRWCWQGSCSARCSRWRTRCVSSGASSATSRASSSPPTWSRCPWRSRRRPHSSPPPPSCWRSSAPA